MRKLLTFLVLIGLLLSLQVSFVSAQEGPYVVVEGDTAQSIADFYGVSVEDLLAANELSSADEIEVGMTLVIPEPAEPAAEPTEEATAEPTEEATAEPTEEATAEPTEEATAEPTEEATAEPTEEATAEPTEEATAEPTEEATAEPTEEATPEPTEEATPEPTEEATAEPTEEATAEPTEEATPEPTEEATAEPTEEATAEPTEEATAEPTTYVVVEGDTAQSIADSYGISVEDLLAANELSSADEIEVGMTLVIPEPAEPAAERTEEATAENDVGVSGTLPGSFNTQIIAIANLLESGSPEAPVMTLYNIDSSGETVVSGMPSVYPGGVGFVSSDEFSTGRYAGVIESSFPAAAAALTVNSSAKTADAYAGFSAPAQELFATLIFNKHSNWESTLICQNAGGGTASITAELYKAGDTSPRVTLTANNVAENNSVVWDIADNSTVQNQWPGGNGEFGFAKFTSANDIACVVDNQRMASPYVQSQYGAVPTSYAGTEAYSPLVFHGHGQSSKNDKAVKWNSGVSIVNTSSSNADVTIVFSADNGYVATCTKRISGNGSANWYMPSVQSLGWACTPNASLPWSYPGPTFGSIKVTANQPILALNNSNRYDGSTLGAGFSSALAVPDVATNRVVCPLAFNKNAASDWVTGVRVANVGSVSTDVIWTMVRADRDPDGSGNKVSITEQNVQSGDGASAYFPEIGSALGNFQGVVFVEASNASALIAATANNTNYNALGAGAQYECINY